MGRRCRTCDTVLSRYNPHGFLCWVHAPKPKMKGVHAERLVREAWADLLEQRDVA